jgi:hypothetical protein
LVIKAKDGLSVDGAEVPNYVKRKPDEAFKKYCCLQLKQIAVT